VRWRGGHYILTAEHVLRETDPLDLRFFFRPDETLRREEREEGRPVRAFLRAGCFLQPTFKWPHRLSMLG